jgi:hypothetical protein
LAAFLFGRTRQPESEAKGLRTFILGLAAFVLLVLGLKVGVGMLDAAAHSPARLDGLRPSFDDTPLHLLPLHVSGLIQKVADRPINSTETAAVLGCILFEATVVGVVFELALGNLGLGLVLNGLVALTGVWVVLFLYDPASSADAFDDLNALVEHALVGSVAAPATLVLPRRRRLPRWGRHTDGRRDERPLHPGRAAGQRGALPTADRPQHRTHPRRHQQAQILLAAREDRRRVGLDWREGQLLRAPSLSHHDPQCPSRMRPNSGHSASAAAHFQPKSLRRDRFQGPRASSIFARRD